MYHPTSSENWLRQHLRFYPFLNSDDGQGANFDLEIFPSESYPAQLTRFPTSLIVRGMIGRGTIDFEDGTRYTVGCGTVVRIAANNRFLMRNELRDTWRLYVVLDGNTGCESFIETLGYTRDESLLEKEAAAVGIELYLPEPEPEKVTAIVTAENRISYPAHIGFSL